jgi:hypothetical protein
MKKKTPKKIEIRLPVESIDILKQTAKLCNVTLDKVVSILLAIYILQEKK